MRDCNVFRRTPRHELPDSTRTCDDLQQIGWRLQEAFAFEAIVVQRTALHQCACLTRSQQALQGTRLHRTVPSRHCSDRACDYDRRADLS